MGNNTSVQNESLVENDIADLEAELAKVDDKKRMMVFEDEDGVVQCINRPNRVCELHDAVEPDLFELTEALLAVSTVVYTFATMRKLALKKIEVPISGTGWWFGWGQKKETVELQGKHLVFAQDSDVSKTSSECQHLKRSIAASDIAKFIDLNFHLYSRFPDKEVNSRKGDALNTKAILDQFSKDEGELVEFDDEFNNKELVYAITINHTDKRVVVVFRGSVTDGRDWATNIDMPLRKIDTPPVLTASGFEEEVKVHRGFASYLMGNPTKCSKTNPHTKIHCIVDNLERLYASNPDYSKYKLYVTGHSLGGALAALLTFMLAGSDRLKDVQRPITAVTFAAPNVGAASYLKGFQQLEKAGVLRHVRVSNNNDIVPVAPPGFGRVAGSIFGTRGYTQTGVSIHLYRRSAMKVAYRGINKWFLDQIGFGFNDFHALKTHRQRMLQNGNRQELEKMTVESLYAKEIVGNFDE